MEHGRFDTSRGERLNNPARIEELRPAQLLKDIGGILPGMTGVDFGCGTGVFALPMAEAVGPEGKVYAVDKSADMLALLKANHPPANLVTVQADVAATGLDVDSADLALCALILHEVDSREKVMNEVWRVLKPGGKIIILEWKMEIDWGPPRSIRIPREKVEQLFRNAHILYKEFIDWSPSCYVITGQKIE